MLSERQFWAQHRTLDNRHTLKQTNKQTKQQSKVSTKRTWPHVIVCLSPIRMTTTRKALYSAMLVFVLSSITFPHSAGQYMASKVTHLKTLFHWIFWRIASVSSELGLEYVFSVSLQQYTMKELLSSLLDSRRWDSKSHNASLELGLELSPWSEWSPTGIPVHATLVCFLVMKVWNVHARNSVLLIGWWEHIALYGFEHSCFNNVANPIERSQHHISPNSGSKHTNANVKCKFIWFLLFPLWGRIDSEKYLNANRFTIITR